MKLHVNVSAEQEEGENYHEFATTARVDIPDSVTPEQLDTAVLVLIETLQKEEES